MSTVNPEEQPQPGFDTATAAQTTQLPHASPTSPAPYYANQPHVPTPYQAAPKQPTATTLKDTNTYALVAVILAFIAPIAGIIFGHLGLNQIKRTGDAGRGLALTAVIYGYCAIALGILFVVLYIGVIAVAIGAASSAGYYSY